MSNYNVYTPVYSSCDKFLPEIFQLDYHSELFRPNLPLYHPRVELCLINLFPYYLILLRNILHIISTLTTSLTRTWHVITNHIILVWAGARNFFTSSIFFLKQRVISRLLLSFCFCFVVTPWRLCKCTGERWVSPRNCNVDPILLLYHWDTLFNAIDTFCLYYSLCSTQ